MIALLFTICLIVALIGIAGSLADSVEPGPAAEGVLTVRGERFLLDGSPFAMWGIRVSSATMDEKQCEHLIAQLDDYKAHGVNAVTVFYQGCRGGNYDPFSPDGAQIDAGHQQRMERIIEACRRRGMVVIVGIFYQAAPFGLRDADAVAAAVALVTDKLRPHRNVIINIANEQNSNEWKKHAHAFDFQDPDNIIAMCKLVHEVDPQRLVGGGGYHHPSSIAIGRSAACDVLLFDTAGPESSAELYRRFRDSGVTGKPIVNVETFGGWTKHFPRGIFPEEQRMAYIGEIEAGLAEDGLSIFFHNNPWCQSTDLPMRYDLAGRGTEADPGIRWYFECLRDRLAEK